jgi:CheY-like chemotaxis protein
MAASPTEGKTILLVEDNPDDEALALRAFRRNRIGAQVLVARDGEEALGCLDLGEGSGGEKEKAAEPLRLPDLVLLDLKLPRVDGLEVLRRIRENERTGYLPVVVLTSSLEPNDLGAAYQQRVSSYIRKPVDFTEFMDVVQLIGRYWLELNHLPDRPEGGYREQYAPGAAG